MNLHTHKNLPTDDWDEPEQSLTEFVTEEASTKDIAKALTAGFLTLLFTIGSAVGTAYLVNDKQPEQVQKVTTHPYAP